MGDRDLSLTATEQKNFLLLVAIIWIVQLGIWAITTFSGSKSRSYFVVINQFCVQRKKVGSLCPMLTYIYMFWMKMVQEDTYYYILC